MSRDLGFIPTHEGFLCVTEKAVEEKLSDVANHQLEWGLLYTLTRDRTIIARQEAFEGQLRHLPMWHQKRLRNRCPLTEIPFTPEPTSPWHNKRERTKQRARSKHNQSSRKVSRRRRSDSNKSKVSSGGEQARRPKERQQDRLRSHRKSSKGGIARTTSTLSTRP